MEFSEQEYSFSFRGPGEKGSIDKFSRRDCNIILETIQGVFSFATEQTKESITKQLQQSLRHEGGQSFLDLLEVIWKRLRNEVCFSLHLPISVLSLITDTTQDDPDASQTKHGAVSYCVLQIGESGEIALKHKDRNVLITLKRSEFNIDREKDWHSYICASVTNLFNSQNPDSITFAFIAWSPAISEYRCTHPVVTPMKQVSNYTVSLRRTSLTYPIVTYTRKNWLPVSECALFGQSPQNIQSVIRGLVQLTEQHQKAIETSDLGKSFKENVSKHVEKTVCLMGHYHPLGVSVFPCLPGPQSLEAVAHSISPNYSEDDFKLQVDENSITIINCYESLKTKLQKSIHELKQKLGTDSTIVEPRVKITKPVEASKSGSEKIPEKKAEKNTLLSQSSSLATIESISMQTYKSVSDSLSQLKAINVSHTVLERPQSVPSVPETTSSKILSEGAKQCQLEVAIRTLYDPPDKTPEMLSLLSNIKLKNNDRTQTLNQLALDVQAIIDKRRFYFESKLKDGLFQPRVLKIWDEFHDNVMPSSEFGELLLDIEADLDIYAFYGIFRDIIYGMYLGIDTRCHMQLLCTSVQAYFSYNLYAESAEALENRYSIKDLLINTNESFDENNAPDTWVNHYQTLLWEIFKLLQDSVQSRIRKVIRFEDELLQAMSST